MNGDRHADFREPRRNIAVTLSLPSELGSERVAMDTAASVARYMGFADERIEDIRTAVSEATTNAIEHGNGLDASRQVLVVLAQQSATLQIDVQDCSPTPFQPIGDAGLPRIEDRMGEDTGRRGWGIFLITSLMDEVEFTSVGDGNLVRMLIHLQR
jgi:serine/threonine-protein kinase RsbW